MTHFAQPLKKKLLHIYNVQTHVPPPPPPIYYTAKSSYKYYVQSNMTSTKEVGSYIGNLRFGFSKITHLSTAGWCERKALCGLLSRGNCGQENSGWGWGTVKLDDQWQTMTLMLRPELKSKTVVPWGQTRPFPSLNPASYWFLPAFAGAIFCTQDRHFLRKWHEGKSTGQAAAAPILSHQPSKRKAWIKKNKK